ncbi:hypothetical protein A5881_002118 [Enterococcus termitis]|nr:hypothetical protein A5881_001561 [Enterococcus termitis]
MNNVKKIFLPSMLCFGIYISTNLPIQATAITENIPIEIEPTTSIPATLELVSVPDKALREAILTQLGKQTDDVLTKQEMETLNSLTITSNISTQIHSLTGLEYATNLAAIFLTNTNVSDFSPLEQLSALTYVNLSSSYLTSTTFPDLSKSTGITHISVNSTQLDNEVLSKFTTLMNLERLYLDKNMYITTLEPLKNLPKLRSISVQFCGIADFTVINDFPALNNLAAFGQNIGRTSSPVPLMRTALTYDAIQQTVFIPFSEMPNRLTNFDGYLPPFTTATSENNTALAFNGSLLPANRLHITDQGIFVSSVTEEDFHNLVSLTYNARINNPAGSYVEPPNYSLYAISSGTYFQQFNVIDEPEDGAPITIKYQDEMGNPINEPTVLEGKIDEPFTVLPKDIDTWVLTSIAGNTEGTFSQNPQEIIFTYEKGLGQPVTIRYLDENFQDIDEPTILSGKIDASFTALPKDIQTWVLKSTPDNTEGTFSQSAQEIIFTYEKALGQPIMIHYTDTEGNQLADTEVLHGQLETAFESISKHIAGWQLTALPENANGIFTNQQQIVHYFYRKIANPLIPVPDSNSAFPTEYFSYGTHASSRTLTHLLKNQSKAPPKLKEAQLIPALFPSTLASARKAAAAPAHIAEKQTAKKPESGDGMGSVTIKFVDEQGNELAKPTTITGKIGESYAVTAKKVKKLD